MAKKLLLVIATILLLTGSCKRSEMAAINDNPPNDLETVQASVSGIVVNENNIPVSGAIVKLGVNTATTNAFGAFRFTNIAMSKNNAHIKVTKAGYFNGNRSFMSTAGRTHNIRIKLLPKTVTGTISAASGGIVTLPSGGKVSFAANILTDAGGNAYTGVVNVAMAWLNPTASDLASTIQGDLRGIITTGGERVLETYGMLGVELTGNAGQELKIATGKTAEISLPIPASIQATAPATIALWHFDETRGRWVEEGSATKTGTNYVGNVKHFSFWNCDVPGNFVTLCVNVVNTNNQPLNNATVRIKRVSNPASAGYGFTDSLGNVCGAVPKNEALTLEILDRCGNVVYSQNIGPYNANASVNVIATIPSTNMLTITGTVVNCNNAAVANGNVHVYTGGAYAYYVPVTNGNFTLSLINCTSTPINFTVLPTDFSTLQQGLPTAGTGSTGTVNMGQLHACGTSTAQFLNILVDGIPFSWVPPMDSVGATNASITPAPGFATTINIYGNNFINPIPRAANFTFNINTNPGTALLCCGSMLLPQSLNTQQIVGQGTSTITELGAPLTGFIAGEFNGATFNFSGIIKTVSGTFRMRRP